MIRQWQVGVLPTVTGECAILTVAWYANLYAGVEISPEMLNYVFDRVLVPSGAVSRDGFINDWVQTYSGFGLDVEYILGRAEPSYACRPGEWEHLHWIDSDGDEHFTAGNGRAILNPKTARYNVTYDPWGFAHTVRTGWVADKRIFREAR